jgi:hypothetical protein
MIIIGVGGSNLRRHIRVSDGYACLCPHLHKLLGLVTRSRSFE